jgi:periplasmic protein TonB
MKNISRPFLYSLLVHFCILAVFIFSFTHTQKTESRTSLKLKMISLPLPMSPSLEKKQILPQPKKEITSIPVQKTTPTTPAPLEQKVLTPSPIAQVAPTQQSITRPSVTASPTPLSSPAETPKVTHPPIAQSVNIEKEFLDAHLGEIRALLIQNLRYPRNAQRLKMQGEVRVSFRLKSDGSVENIEVVKSSGFEILDEDAKALIKNTAPQFPKPSKSINLSIPLSYLLR